MDPPRRVWALRCLGAAMYRHYHASHRGFHSELMCREHAQEATARYHRRRSPSSGISCPPYLVGLTGGIACGKSTVSQQLRALGAASVDCDRLAHKAYEPGTPTHRKLVQLFGGAILLPGEYRTHTSHTACHRSKNPSAYYSHHSYHSSHTYHSFHSYSSLCWEAAAALGPFIALCDLCVS